MRFSIFLVALSFWFSWGFAQAQISSYSINETLIGPGQLSFDIDNDSNDDYLFDILALPNGTLAARVVPTNASKILDNSTFGYPDALVMNDEVAGYFHSNVGVLGTFTNAGQFNGSGTKYLGIKINSGGMDYLGWIQLKCSYNRDTLSIISCGFQTIPNEPINAGQTVASGTGISLPGAVGVAIYPNPCTDILNISGPAPENYHYSIFSISGQELLSGATTNKGAIDVHLLSNGQYLLNISSGNRKTSQFITISR